MRPTQVDFGIRATFWVDSQRHGRQVESTSGSKSNRQMTLQYDSYTMNTVNPTWSTSNEQNDPKSRLDSSEIAQNRQGGCSDPGVHLGRSKPLPTRHLAKTSGASEVVTAMMAGSARL